MCMHGRGRAGGGEDMDVHPQRVCVCTRAHGAAWHACAHAVCNCAALVDMCTCKETCAACGTLEISRAPWGKGGWGGTRGAPSREGKSNSPYRRSPPVPHTRWGEGSHESCQGGGAWSPTTSGAPQRSPQGLSGTLRLRIGGAWLRLSSPAPWGGQLWASPAPHALYCRQRPHSSCCGLTPEKPDVLS